MNILLVVIGSQLLFTTGDLLARHNMQARGFAFSTFLAWWFLVYVVLRSVATLGQLFVFTNMEVGKTMALFGASSLVLVNVLGFFLLGEKLSLPIYFGIMLAVAAILIVGFGK
jgi:multidrug transporter EmrE-like cation transporter